EQTEEGSIWERKKQLCKKRGYEIIRIRGSGEVFQTLRVDNQLYYSYILHVSFLMKRDQHFYIEEQAVPYQFHLAEGMIAGHTALSLLTRQKRCRLYRCKQEMKGEMTALFMIGGRRFNMLNVGGMITIQ